MTPMQPVLISKRRFGRATFEVEQPLPHLEVDHQLLLTTDDYPGKLGTALVVEYVRVELRQTKRRPLRYEVHVFCREQVRPPPL